MHIHGLPTLLPSAHTTIHTRPHFAHLCAQDLTLRAKDSLVSFGERLSTRIFASYLRANGVPAHQVGGSWRGFDKLSKGCEGVELGAYPLSVLAERVVCVGWVVWEQVVGRLQHVGYGNGAAAGW